MGMLYGIFFTGGLAFSDPGTVLPVFLGNFTDSKILIGLSAAIMGTFGGIVGGIGTLLPQLFVASKLENKVSKRPVKILPAARRRMEQGGILILIIREIIRLRENGFLTLIGHIIPGVPIVKTMCARLCP